jgi:hypothetical protein
VETVGEQVVVRGATDGLRQAAAQFTLQKPHYPANPLQREAAAAQVGYDRHFRQIVKGIQAPMALPGGNDNALLVPPLQLPGGNAGKLNHLCGRETLWHLLILLF